MSELCCQAAVGLLHVHHFTVGSQNVELPKPFLLGNISGEKQTWGYYLFSNVLTDTHTAGGQ